jgi:hypothetical protein
MKILPGWNLSSSAYNSAALRSLVRACFTTFFSSIGIEKLENMSLTLFIALFVSAHSFLSPNAYVYPVEV